MIKEKKERVNRQIEIDLTGPEGNVFFLIGTGVKWCKEIGLDPVEFREKMMSSDYENAVQTFEDYFGDFVILYR